MFRSVRARITLWNIGIVALTLLATGVALRLTVEGVLQNAMDRELRERLQREPRGRGRPPGGPEAGNPPPPVQMPNPPDMPRMPNPPHSFGRDDFPAPPPQDPPIPNPLASVGTSPFRLPPRLLDKKGREVRMGVQNPMWSERGFQEALSGNETWYTEILNGERVRVFSRPQRLPNEEMGVIQAIAPLEEIERAVQGVTITLLLLLPVALLFAGVGGAVLTERALHPVRDLTAAARGIQTSNLSARLPVSGGDEFARLSDVLNGMLQRLEDGFHRERRFTADASHELKTPLAIIKANTSLGLEDNTLPPDYHKTLRTIDRATDRANRIVQDLLFLAREGKGSVPLRCERILLQTLFQEAIDSVGGEAQRITLGEIPDSSVQGDRHHLTRLLTNLLGNAVRYTPFPGTITLSGRIEGGFVLFEVRDTGEGIPAEHLPHLMEPFYRVDAARTRDSGGSGLGLAICRSIARSHGGDIQISSAVGHGTTVTVRLPRSSV